MVATADSRRFQVEEAMEWARYSKAVHIRCQALSSLPPDACMPSGVSFLNCVLEA